MKKYLFLILLVALFLRLPLLDGSFWLDEAAQALESSRPISQQHIISDDFQPPLFHYIVHFMLFLTSSEAGLRSFSVVAGLVSIAALYFIIKERVGEQSAIIVGWLLAINPFHIFFSQELRPYALAAMFACLSWWALISKSQRNLKNLVFILVTIGGLYTMYLYPFILFSQLIYVFMENRKTFKSVIFNSFIAVTFFVPWLPFFLEQVKVGISLSQGWPGWSQVVATPILKAVPLVLAKFMIGEVELKDSIFFYLLSGIAVAILLIATWSVWREKKHRFLVYWFIVTILMAWLISFAVPVIQPKRVMVVLPAMVGILAVWAAGKEQFKRQLALYFVGVIFLLSSLMYWTTPKYQRENWRDLILKIEQDASGKKSAVVFAFSEPFAPWKWYEGHNLDSFTTRTLKVNSEEELNVTLKPVLDFRRVYVFDYLIDLTDPQGYVKTWFTHRGYEGIRSIDGGNVGFVRVLDSL